MAKLPTPKIGTRVKVSILPSSDAKESVELDYRMMVTGDFSKKSAAQKGRLKDRRVLEIKKRGDFKTVLQNVNPQLKMVIPNRMSDDPEAKMEVNLDIKDMKDFNPDEICKSVEPLKALMQARERLKKLRQDVLQNPELKDALEGILQGGSGSIDTLLSKLEPTEKKPA
jgi:type VI secretion system protein ImpB